MDRQELTEILGVVNTMSSQLEKLKIRIQATLGAKKIKADILMGGRPKKQRQSLSILPMLPFGTHISDEIIKSVKISGIRDTRLAKFGGACALQVFQDPRFQNISLKSNSGKVFDGTKWISFGYEQIVEKLESCCELVERVFGFQIQKMKMFWKSKGDEGAKRYEELCQIGNDTVFLPKIRKSKRVDGTFALFDYLQHHKGCRKMETTYTNHILKRDFE